MGLFDAFKKKKPASGPRPALPPRPMMRPGMVNKPDPQAENNFIIITLDSCRWDSFVAAEPASAAVKLLPDGLDEQRRFFQTFPPLWEPYFGWGERVTVRRELVPGVIWSLEQEQALDVLVSVPGHVARGLLARRQQALADVLGLILIDLAAQCMGL